MINLNLKRHELCDIMLALGIISRLSKAKKWKQLHTKIADILHRYDKLNELEESL